SLWGMVQTSWGPRIEQAKAKDVWVLITLLIHSPSPQPPSPSPPSPPRCPLLPVSSSSSISSTEEFLILPRLILCLLLGLVDGCVARAKGLQRQCEEMQTVVKCTRELGCYDSIIRGACANLTNVDPQCALDCG
ncbi:unnamed protein product, partial [Prorocentrum cordatum]